MVEKVIAAARKENVLIAAGPCSATLLPQFGGKIASIRYLDRELMQAPLAPVAERTQTMPFDAGDASGWDECLPSVAACAVETAAGVAEVPDHGDLWRVAWEVVGQDESSVTLRGACFSLPLVLERKLTLTETAMGARLRADYTIKNTGEAAVPWSWAAHPLFAADEGDEIELPESITELRVEGSGGERLGAKGAKVSWPVAELAAGSKPDLRIAQAADAGIGDKLFTGQLQADENWCALKRPKAGVRVRVGFDPEATPYLGLWICYGGWPERPGPKQMCVALEPATAPVDSLAVSGPWSQTLAPCAWYAWPMTIDLERL